MNDDGSFTIISPLGHEVIIVPDADFNTCKDECCVYSVCRECCVPHPLLEYCECP